MIEEEKNQFAVLIDADNISPKYAPIIFQELEAYGFPSCRRIYGNWSKANGWNEELLLEYSIIPVQQFSYTSGKNATDMAMVIDAMDLLYGKKVDGFCIVTSDSDFTRLAATLKEEGKMVVGMGESKTPMALRNACDNFKVLDLLYKESAEAAAEKAEEKNPKTGGARQKTGKTKLTTIEKAIKQIIEANGDDNGMNISTLGNSLQRRYPDFDTRNYGSAKFSKFLSQFKSITLTKIGNSTYANIK